MAHARDQSADPASAAARAREYFASIQDENGVDLTLIMENLRLSPHERLVKAERGRLAALQLRNHAKRTDPRAA